MLVLSRRQGEKIVLPGINTSVQVVSVRPGLVRLGITAPPEVTVLREEIAGRNLPSSRPTEPAPSPLRALNHAVRDRLNAATIGIALLRRQLAMGQPANPAGTLDRIEGELQALLREVEQFCHPSMSGQPTLERQTSLVRDDGV